MHRITVTGVSLCIVLATIGCEKRSDNETTEEVGNHKYKVNETLPEWFNKRTRVNEVLGRFEGTGNKTFDFRVAEGEMVNLSVHIDTIRVVDSNRDSDFHFEYRMVGKPDFNLLCDYGKNYRWANMEGKGIGGFQYAPPFTYEGPYAIELRLVADNVEYKGYFAKN